MYVCGGVLRQDRSACPDPLHDYPELISYTGAAEEASSRLYHGWSQRKCKQCGLYGWNPGGNPQSKFGTRQPHK